MATAQPLNGEMIPPGVTETSESLTETFSPMNLLSLALQNNAAIDVIERLAALQEKMMLRDAAIRFHDALSRAQAEIKRVAPDLQNPQTSSRYASYAAIDRVIRPIYTQLGMSLSFSHADCPKPDHVRVLCFASLGAYTRTYQLDMPTDGKGPKGSDVMTKTHATAAADSYAKRYLVKDIFNIAIGEEDTDGNDSGSAFDGIPLKRVEQLCAAISTARDMNELHTRYMAAGREAQRTGDRRALRAFIQVKDARKAALR
jgi:hypothetical protein